MSDKRFQECNWLEKLWRYRWYIPIPFTWSKIILTKGSSLKKDGINGRTLWGILIGDAQGKMKWYHTMEEMKEFFEQYDKED